MSVSPMRGISPHGSPRRSPAGSPVYFDGSASPDPFPDYASSIGSISMSPSSLRTGRASSAASVAIKLRVRHQREVKMLFSKRFRAIEDDEEAARGSWERQEHEERERVAADFFQGYHVFADRHRTAVVYAELVQRGKLLSEQAAHFEALYRFSSERLLPVKLEAIQIQALRVQALMWVSQGLFRAEIFDRMTIVIAEAVEVERLVARSRQLSKICRVATLTLHDKDSPAVDRLTSSEQFILRQQWIYLHRQERLRILSHEKMRGVFATMLHDLLLTHGANRARIEWDEEKEANHLRDVIALEMRKLRVSRR